MKIFLIARGYPTPQGIQWGCFEKDQAEALVEAGHEVTIICYRQHPFIPYLGYWTHSENGVNVVSFCAVPGRVFGVFGSPLRRMAEKVQLELAYKKAVKLHGDPDILYSHYLFVTDIAAYLKEKFHKPLVAIEHWSEVSNPSLQPFVKKIGERAYPRVDKIISVSDSLRDAINDRFGFDSVVIHNLIGKEFTFDCSRTPSDKIRFVSTGSLIYRKGYDLLVEAFGLANIDRKKWQLTIIGSGGEKEKLEKRISELGLSDNILLPGGTNKPGVVKALSNSDVFVLPSRNENFSVSVLEALSCGLPVIASICGGIRECITEKNGLLFTVDNVKELSKCLENMIANFNSYSPKEISKDCYDRYSPAKVADQITLVLNSIIKQN